MITVISIRYAEPLELGWRSSEVERVVESFQS